MYNKIVDFIKSLYPDEKSVPLHAPVFIGNEKKYLSECIDSSYVSYVGGFVTKFENMMSIYTGAKYAVATVNGTCALHAALVVSGVKQNDDVITQPLTFIATVNAIKYAGANPVFVDVDRSTLGIFPEKLQGFFEKHTIIKNDGNCYNKISGNIIKACIPMHTFGHPVEIDEIVDICNKHNVMVIEDAAESLGSFYKNRHTGIFGNVGILSFNGNKTITTGGGGMVLTNDENTALRLKHITTTAKKPHKWDFIHDEVGYNYRMPNLNATVGCAQMESIDKYIESKRELAFIYKDFFDRLGISFFTEPKNCTSNYWLNVIILKDRDQRNEFLKYSNENGVMSRPIWTLMYKLEMYKNCIKADCENSEWLEERVVNIPSSVRINKIEKIN